MEYLKPFWSCIALEAECSSRAGKHAGLPWNASPPRERQPQHKKRRQAHGKPITCDHHLPRDLRRNQESRAWKLRRARETLLRDPPMTQPFLESLWRPTVAYNFRSRQFSDSNFSELNGRTFAFEAKVPLRGLTVCPARNLMTIDP